MAAVEGPVRAKEFRDARAEADTDKQMDIDSQAQPVGDGEDLYTQLKVWQRQLEFYEIQVVCCLCKIPVSCSSCHALAKLFWPDVISSYSHRDRCHKAQRSPFR